MSGLLGASLVLSAMIGFAQEGTPAPKPAKVKPAKKRARTAPNADGSTPPPANLADLPLGVQDNLTEAKRLQERYRREEAARRRAEAEARRKGLPWPPPEETSPESLPPAPSTPDTPPPPQPAVSQPAPPLEYNPPPAAPPVETQATTSQSGNNPQNPAGPPPSPPADGRTVIRTWPLSKKPAKPMPPQ